MINNKGLVPYFGAKRTMAPKIVQLLGKHTAYFEPFCGSMAVLLAKEPCRSETVNDMESDLCLLAQVIASGDDFEVLCRALKNTFASEDHFRKAAWVLQGGRGWVPKTTRAWAYFVVNWLGHSGHAGTEQKPRFAIRYTSNGGDTATRFRSAIEGLDGIRRRLDKVLISNRCGIEMCERIEDKLGTVIYADPPYLREGGEYKHKFTTADHSRLATALARFQKTRVVVSYYDDPQLEILYPAPHWDKISLPMKKSLGSGIAPEVLLVKNGEEA